MKQPSLFFFSPGLFDDLRRDYARQEDLKKRSAEQEIQYLKNVNRGLKAYNTQLKKRL